MDDVLLIVCHGSKDLLWQNSMVKLHKHLSSHLPIPVHLSFLQFCTPTFVEKIDELKDQYYMWIWPIFIAKGEHVDREIPLIINQKKLKHYTLFPPLGEDKLFLDFLPRLFDHHYKGS